MLQLVSRAKARQPDSHPPHFCRPNRNVPATRCVYLPLVANYKNPHHSPRAIEAASRADPQGNDDIITFLSTIP